MDKKKVSAFEYAIMEAVNKEGIKHIDIEKYEPLTPAEELQRREDNLKAQAEKIFGKI